MSKKPKAGLRGLLSASERRRQYGIAASVLVVGIALSAFVCAVLRDKEHNRVREEFEQRSQDHVSALNKTLDRDLMAVKSLELYYVGLKEVDRSEFAVFAAPLMTSHPSLRALQWAPRVLNSNRSQFTAAAARDGYRDFQITQYDRSGKLVPATRREEYYPIYFVAPFHANLAAWGFDLATNPACLEAMNRSRDTNRPVMTSGITLPDEHRNQGWVGLFTPVYRDGTSINTVDNRRENLVGFLVGVLRLNEIIRESLSAISPTGIDIHVLDSTDPRHEQPLLFYETRLREPDAAAAAKGVSRQRQGLRLVKTLDVAGRRWTVICEATPQFLAVKTTWYPWGASALCLLLTFSLTMYLAGIAARNVRAAQFVARLAEANRELEKEIAERMRAEQRQSRLLARVERMNRLQEDLLLPTSSEEKFKQITDAAVELLDLDFCRIWMVKPGDLCQSGCIHATAAEECNVCPRHDQCLHLMASSGRYTHIDGDHRRVPIGYNKIGRIANNENRKFLSNNVTTDPEITDHPWAKDLGLVSFDGYKLRDADGSPTGVLAMFSKHTISEEDDAFLSNLAETASRFILDERTRDALGHENAKLSAMIGGMEEGVVFADADNVIVEINDYLCRFAGRLREEILGKRIEDIHGGAALERILLWIDQFRARVGSEPFVLERPLGGADVILRMQPIYRDGKYDGVLLNVIDVSALVKARREAEIANAAKSRFLANMSHEIRTPMTAILGYADLLANPLLSPSNRNNYLATVRRSGEHLLALINDILDLSKIEAGKMALDVGRCNVVAMLADVASMVRPRADQRGVAFSVEYPGEIPETILTDAPRLRQAIVNLAGNAVKFTERGSVRIAASLLKDWCGDQPAVRIEVIDTGIGIREEVLPNLFQPFSQGDAAVSVKFGGTGLGLAISHHIAHLLGGELTVASTWGQGSDFTLTVPTGGLEDVPMLQNPAEVMQECSPHVWKSTAEDLRGVRILLAEDGFDNRELIQTVLRMAGAEVEAVENGRLAVDKARCEPFDLILMDMNMPEMDGYEATRLLRACDYPKPIVALTANAMSGDSEHCLAAGCDEYVPKPIHRAQLLHTIAKLVGKGPAEGPASAGGHGPGAEAIVSQFIDDPDMAPIIQGFVERLAGQLDAMRQVLAGGQHEEMRRLAHKLKGAGGSYGYPMLTEACSTLEEAARTSDAAATGTALEAVAALIQAIQNGYFAGVPAGGNA